MDQVGIKIMLPISLSYPVNLITQNWSLIKLLKMTIQKTNFSKKMQHKFGNFHNKMNATYVKNISIQ